jgi:hypothetical protein
VSDYDRIEELPLDHGTVRVLLTSQGTRYTHSDCERRFQAGRNAMTRWFARWVRTRTEWNDADMRAYTLRDLRAELDDIASYVESARKELDRIEDVDRVTDRVRALREVAGRTPEEAKLYLAKAEALDSAKNIQVQRVK